MTQLDVSCTGAREAGRMLRNVGYRALHQSATFDREAHDAQRRISGIPVATGRLERGVKGGAESIVNVRDDGYTLATMVPYARFVFGGTKTMRARPPRIPTDLGTRAAQGVGADLRRA